MEKIRKERMPVHTCDPLLCSRDWHHTVKNHTSIKKKKDDPILDFNTLPEKLTRVDVSTATGRKEPDLLAVQGTLERLLQQHSSKAVL